MRLADMNNLWVGYSRTDDFRICIAAFDAVEALQIANDYARDSGLYGPFTVSRFEDENTQFDCDYIICQGD